MIYYMINMRFQVYLQQFLRVTLVMTETILGFQKATNYTIGIGDYFLNMTNTDSVPYI